MKLGIKVGPQRQSILDLEQTRAPFAEVWFRVDKKDDYNGIFSYLKQKRIDTGLHFWGLTKNGLLPTLVHDDPALVRESIDLIRQTIDIAAQNGFSYVNIHPGFPTRMSVDYESMAFTPKDTYIVPLDQSAEQFRACTDKLSAYATDRRVLLTIETTPVRVPAVLQHGNNASRQEILDVPEFSLTALPVDTIHFAVANDFGHTAADCISPSANAVWEYLHKKTEELAPRTRLLHLGYVVPPYNGTDFHDHLDNPLFETANAVPNKNQMMELLKLFNHRDNVWALVEPNGRHPENYFLAQKLLTSLK